jgi:hypothetical protein
VTITLQQASRARERRFFVGRERELSVFRSWLASGEAAILAVSGPSGIGKTALLAAFEREAGVAGRPTVWVDGSAVLPTEADFLAALGQRDLEEAICALGATRPLVVFDAFEALGGVTRYVREQLVPRLDARVRLVVAGRHPLDAWHTGERWPVAIRSLALEPLDGAESREYLARRGVTGSELCGQILASCGGWPLALSLAADLVEQLELRRLSATPEWHLAVKALVEQLLQEASEPALRTLIEAGAVVQRFDEETLAAIAGRPPGDAFAALCRLSIVRPTARGLALHDDVRRLVADDLRWRQPERYRELRLRAIEHLRRLAARAPADERERLLEERLFLWGHEVARSLLYAADEPGELWVEPARPEDRLELIALHRRWQSQVRPALGFSSADVPWDAERHWRWFEQLVSHPAARVRIARHRTGDPLGYDVVLPVREATLPLVRAHDVISRTVDAYGRLVGVAPAEQPDLVFLAHLGLAGPLPEATRSALIRDLLSVLARGGVCLCSLDLEEYRRLAEALGFRPVPGSETRFRGDAYLGYALDLTRVGPEPWLRALLAQRPLPPVGPGELERELRDVLIHWHDDRRLAASSLAALVPADAPAHADAVRSLVEAAVRRAQALAASDHELALSALELAYIRRAGTHEHVADELHVSRATFYRLLHRGLGLTAAALPGAVEG